MENAEISFDEKAFIICCDCLFAIDFISPNTTRLCKDQGPYGEWATCGWQRLAWGNGQHTGWQQRRGEKRQWLILVRGTCKDLYGAVSTEERL